MNKEVMKNKTSISSSQGGFASIVVALILIIVLALLTIAFAQLARREQQNALNKQLSTQANYAAESGINDLYTAIRNRWLTANTGGYIDGDKGKNCLKFPLTLDNGTTLSNRIDGTNDVSYSCALVNLEPTALVWQDISPGSHRWSTFSTDGSLEELTVSWGSGSNRSAFRPQQNSSMDFLTFDAWKTGDYLPVLEVSLTPLDDNAGTATFTRSDLVNKTFTVYLYPSGNNSNSQVGGTVTYSTSAANQAQVINGTNCSRRSTDFPCSVKIKGIPHSNAGETYLIRIVNHYDTANVVIGNAKGATAGEKLVFRDGQAQIDITGKARNVLKRLRVTVPLKETAKLPPSIEGQSICKRLSVESGAGDFSTPSTIPAYGLSACVLDQ